MWYLPLEIWNGLCNNRNQPKCQKFQKFQNAPKLIKLNMIVDWQVWMRLLTMEFRKRPPLPWKLQKCQKFLKCFELNET